MCGERLPAAYIAVGLICICTTTTLCLDHGCWFLRGLLRPSSPQTRPISVGYMAT